MDDSTFPGFAEPGLDEEEPDLGRPDGTTDPRLRPSADQHAPVGLPHQPDVQQKEEVLRR